MRWFRLLFASFPFTFLLMVATFVLLIAEIILVVLGIYDPS